MAAQDNAQENFRAVVWRDGAVVLIDQAHLPHEEVWLTLRTPDAVAQAIRTMQVRGAPAIGVAGVAGVALAVHEWDAQDTRMAHHAHRYARRGTAGDAPDSGQSRLGD